MSFIGTIRHGPVTTPMSPSQLGRCFPRLSEVSMNTFARTRPFPEPRFPEHLLCEVLWPWPDPQGHGVYSPFSTSQLGLLQEAHSRAPFPTSFVFKGTENGTRGFWSSQCTHFLKPTGRSCTQDGFLGTHPTPWLPQKPVSWFSFLEPEHTGPLEVFFGVACGAGCRHLGRGGGGAFS